MSTTRTSAPTIPLPRFLFLWVYTFGMYEIYWIYQMWRVLKREGKLSVNPILRTFFAVIFFPSLCFQVKKFARRKNIRVYIPAIILGIITITQLISSYPHPIAFIFFVLVWLLFLPIVYTMNQCAQSEGVIKSRFLDFSRGEKIIFSIASTFWICLISLFTIFYFYPDLFLDFLETKIGQKLIQLFF